MLFNISTGLKRTFWSAASAALAILCASPATANGIIAPARRFDGGRLSVQTQTGSNCSSSSPDRAAISATAGVRGQDRFSGINYNSQDLLGGVSVTIPFGASQKGDCSKLLKIEEARNSIDLAVTLFEAGAMSADEFKEVMERARAVLH